MSFIEEIKRRRTFGIISHPDAGKTTLTEKLLLFGGAIQIAGEINYVASRTFRDDSVEAREAVRPDATALVTQ